MRYFIIVMMFALQSVLATEITEWLAHQKQKSLSYLLDNISRGDTRPGFVVASPSKTEPPYYFHWVRDAALVMSALDQYLDDGEHKQKLFDDYIQLVLQNQQQNTLTGLGEPKFNPDGSGYEGPWGRPQNDGPALRALTLTKYALKLLESGNKDYVSEYLYRSELPANTAIKRDLEYVSHHWQSADFDLWEEVKGHHFYTRMVQRAALFYGVKLARKLGDDGAANWYEEQFELINEKLNDHYDESKQIIVSTINRVSGLDYKHSGLDASVILAVNHASIDGLSFSYDDPRVFETFIKIKQSFKEAYNINNIFEGVAIGRYPEDTYYGGNPWFLTTNAFAEYVLKLTKTADKKRQYLMMRKHAKSYLLRVKRHMSVDGRMDEQFHRDTGYMLGAKDLTWSYASFLTIPNL